MEMSANSFGIIVGIIAIVISVGSLYISYRVSTSDYQVAQEAKVDITTLLSATHNIMYKYARLRLSPSKDGEIDISSEQKVVQNFLLSPTRSGFNKLVYEKVELARKKETQEEPWRLFLYTLNVIVTSDSIMKEPVEVNLASLLIATKHVTDLFSNMKKNDIQIVLSEMKNLDNLVKNQKRYVEKSSIFSVIQDLIQRIEEKAIADSEKQEDLPSTTPHTD